MSSVPALDIDHLGSNALVERVRQMAEDLESERARLDEAVDKLGRAERELAAAERDKAVAKAEGEESSRRAEDERRGRELIESRVVVLKADRDLALAAMGWWSRSRYKRRRRKAQK